MGGNDKAVKVHTLPSLVDCLVKLGGISDAQATLHLELPSKVLHCVNVWSVKSLCALSSTYAPACQPACLPTCTSDNIRLSACDVGQQTQPPPH